MHKSKERVVLVLLPKITLKVDKRINAVPIRAEPVVLEISFGVFNIKLCGKANAQVSDSANWTINKILKITGRGPPSK